MDPQTSPQYEVVAEAGPGTRIPRPTAIRIAVSQMESFFIVEPPKEGAIG
jgi:hypothetical protein